MKTILLRICESVFRSAMKGYILTDKVMIETLKYEVVAAKKQLSNIKVQDDPQSCLNYTALSAQLEDIQKTLNFILL